MSERNDGGPAFPGRRLEEIKNALDDGTHRDWVEYPGMSLRDWFAAKAMQGFVASGADTTFAEIIPEWSYRMADAMLDEREN